MNTPFICLLVTAAPFAGRESRAELDVAMAAAAMDYRLEVYFLGDALMQLAREVRGAAALLPPGLKGWSALPELGEVSIFAEQSQLARLEDLGIATAVEILALDENSMRTRWREAAKVMVI